MSPTFSPSVARHALGRRAGGEPARLQHQDLAARRPRLVRQAPAAPAWSCPRRAARPARRHCRRASAAVRSRQRRIDRAGLGTVCIALKRTIERKFQRSDSCDLYRATRSNRPQAEPRSGGMRACEARHCDDGRGDRRLSRNGTQIAGGRAMSAACHNRERIDWVDYAKGFCIVFVVMMHSTLGVEAALGQEGWMHYVGRVRQAVPHAGLLPDLRPVPRPRDRPRLAHLSRPQGRALRLFLRAVGDDPVRLQGARASPPSTARPALPRSTSTPSSSRSARCGSSTCCRSSSSSPSSRAACRRSWSG